MPLDWLNTPVDVPISELIARKKRARTIETLRAQLQGRLAPGVQVRLQLADLLVQAGRGDEAVPVLIGLADEFAADGFVAKAIAILKRVEKVHGSQAEVASRLSSLVQQQRKAARAGGGERPAGRAEPLELGMEEIDPSAPFDTDTGPLPLESAAPAPDPAEPPPPPALSPAMSGARDDAPAPPGAGADPAASAGVAQRIRGVFRRFLASLPNVEEGAPRAESAPPEAPASPPPLEEPAAAAPAAAGDAAAAPPPEPPPPATPVAPVIEPPPVEAPPAIEPAPAEASGEEAALEAEVIEVDDDPPAGDLEITIEPDPPVEPEAGLTAQDYEARLLDIVEDVLHRPPPPPDAAARPRVVEYAHRLLGTPLLSDLSEEELLAVVRGLRVHTFEAGDVILTERQPGQSLFIVTSGRVKVFIRNPAGRNYLVAQLGEGEFFGEIASLSGRPRTATVVAAAPADVLELDKATLDGIARLHPRVKDVLETAYIDRASSPEAAAVRAVTVKDPHAPARAIDVLEAHFGESRWDPRMRLRLADVLLRAGKEQDAVPILVGLADDLAREGYPEKAIAILKKIERLQSRHIEEVSLAPASRRPGARGGAPETRPAIPIPPPPAAAPGAPAPARRRARTDDRLEAWLVDTVRHAVVRSPAAAPAQAHAYGPGLRASPLFEGFAEEELLAVIRGLRLLGFGPGDVIVSEGEPGQSVFLLASGAVKVFVRDAEGASVLVSRLGEGAFFGEISALSGRPRSATVTAAAPCDLLELDRPTLDRIAAAHPRVRTVLEEYSRRRAADPAAAAARGRGADGSAGAGGTA
jgi:CRP-like cAMP-binding protein